MYSILNDYDQYGNVKKHTVASLVGLSDEVASNNGYVYYCGSNNRMNDNKLMLHLWKKPITQNTANRIYVCVVSGISNSDANGDYWVIQPPQNINSCFDTVNYQVLTNGFYFMAYGDYYGSDGQPSWFIVSDLTKQYYQQYYDQQYDYWDYIYNEPIRSGYYDGNNTKKPQDAYWYNCTVKQYYIQDQTIKYKSCFSNVHCDNGDSYYLITSDGKLYVGGQGQYYILGRNSHSDVTYFTQIAAGYNWKKVVGRYSASGSQPTCYFLTQEGDLFFSGRQTYAYYGNGSQQALQNVITQFNQSGVKVEDIQCMYGGSLILDKDGYIWSKGYNREGQLGNGQFRDWDGKQNYYQKISLIDKQPQNNWVKIAAGYNFCCAINSNGQLYVWGGNQYGQLGDGTTVNKNKPQLLSNGKILFDDVSAGSHHIICKDIQGNIYAIGRNNYGQLGDGTTVDKNQLTKIFSKINARKVVAGQYSSAIIDNNGGCYCVGYCKNTIVNGYTGNILQWTKLGYKNNIAHISMSKNNFCLIGE